MVLYCSVRIEFASPAKSPASVSLWKVSGTNLEQLTLLRCDWQKEDVRVSTADRVSTLSKRRRIKSR